MEATDERWAVIRWFDLLFQVWFEGNILNFLALLTSSDVTNASLGCNDFRLVFSWWLLFESVESSFTIENLIFEFLLYFFSIVNDSSEYDLLISILFLFGFSSFLLLVSFVIFSSILFDNISKFNLLISLLLSSSFLSAVVSKINLILVVV